MLTRLSSGLTFSKEVGAQKIFTVEASKATDFRDRDASLLEDVKITIFGKTGERHDTIHTQAASTKKRAEAWPAAATCRSTWRAKRKAERAAKNPEASAQQEVPWRPAGWCLTAPGTSANGPPVKFVFPNGNGQAVGSNITPKKGTMRLLSDVRFSLAPPGNDIAGKKNSSGGAKEPVHVVGRASTLREESRTMQLQGPVEAQNARGRACGRES